MRAIDVQALEAFIVQAKQVTYVGNGRRLLSYRPGSQDLQFADGDWTYHDSYFGQQDFMGQEIVYYQLKPVWGMNYYGYILRPDLLTTAQGAQMIRQSLSRMYAEGRFLGAFTHAAEELTYVDTNHGDVHRFSGRETIARSGELAYELLYHGGLLRH